MTIGIGSNILSLNAQRRLAATTSSLSSTFEKLSTGLRINKASDDAAGLAISETLSADTRVYAQAMRNVSDGISALTIEEGALDALTNILIRQRELAEQAANGTYSNLQRKAMDDEADALVAEFNRIVESTSFNGRKLLEAAGAELRIQAGYGTAGGVVFELAEALARTVGTGSFTRSASFAMETGITYAVSLGDLNRDGALDMVTAGDATAGAGRCTIRLGNGDGTFKAALSYVTEGNFSRALTLSDLDGNGILDLITAGSEGTDPNAEGYATIRLGNGDGTFKAAASYMMEDSVSRAVTLGDLNGDGVLDLVTAGTDGTTVEPHGFATIRIGNGNGTFKEALSYTMQNRMSLGVSLGDIDGNGVLDLLTAGNEGSSGLAGSVRARLGNGDGTFAGAVTFLTDYYLSEDISLSDVNEDGALDIVTAGDGSGFFGTTVRLGNGDGTFGTRRTQVSEGWGSHGLSVSDLNGDGHLDLLTVGDGTFGGGGPGYGTIRLGNGDGTFGTRASYPADGLSSWALSLGDVNGDGVSDLVTAGQKTGAIGGATVHLSGTRQMVKMGALNLRNAGFAREAMGIIDEMLDRVATERGAIGAIQSRLAAAVNTLSVAGENFSTAISRIKDADVAEASAELVRTRILQQAASAVLAQANEQPALALRLLSG